MNPTIAAIATAAAPAGIGVIRLSGPEAFGIADKIFRGKKHITSMKGYTACYGHIYDENGTVDECVATVFRKPRSYTGEDTVELSCHGGRYLLNRALRALLSAGAKTAEAGEFTKRAFLNGKLDLTAAESVMTLIRAENDAAVKLAWEAKDGALYKEIEKIKTGLLKIEAQIAAFIDYPDEDIPEPAPDELDEQFEQIIKELEKLRTSFQSGKTAREGVDAVIAGSPNVGKSTLMNLLTGYDGSIVTDQEGTTRDIIEESVRMGKITLRLSDTAGLRETKEKAESIGVERAKQKLEHAQLILAVFDGTKALTDAEKAWIEELREKTCIAVINKTDKPQMIDEAYIRGKIQRTVSVSAKTGQGKKELIRRIENLIESEMLYEGPAALITERQREGVETGLQYLQSAKEDLCKGYTLDAISVSIDSAIYEMMKLTGERVTDEIVNTIFSQFCVGK